MREELKKAKKHFGIKLSKIFGEETEQVKKEFHDLLRPEDSLVTAAKIVQQHFPNTDNHNLEKTKVVQQSLAAQIETPSANSEKNKPEKTITSLGEKLQATNSAKFIQRKDGLAVMEKIGNSLEGGAGSFSATVKKFPQPQPSNWRSIFERLPGMRRLAPMKQAKKVNEQNQTDTFPHGFDQQRKASVTHSTLLNSSFQKRQPSTVSRERH